MKQVLSKKFLWLIPLCIFLVLTGCFQKTDENVSRDDEAVSGVQIAQPEGSKVTQFAVKDEFEISLTHKIPATLEEMGIGGSDVCWDLQDDVKVILKNSKYGEIKLPLAIWDEVCDGTVSLDSVLDKAYLYWDNLYIPMAEGREATILHATTYKYNISTKKLEKQTPLCVPFDNAEVLDNGIIKWTVPWFDYEWTERITRENVVYCDLKTETRYDEATYLATKDKLTGKSSADTANNQEKKDHEFINTYYRMLENHQFSELFAITLRKWETKVQNPFDEWYRNVTKAEVLSIEPKGDRTYEIKTQLTNNVYEDKPSRLWPPALLGEKKSKYLATKKVVERDGKLYLDGIESKEITPKRVCDKVVEDARVLLKNYTIPIKDSYLSDTYWSSEDLWVFKDDNAMTAIRKLDNRVKTNLWEWHSDFFEKFSKDDSRCGGDTMWECYIGDYSRSTSDKKHTFLLKGATISLDPLYLSGGIFMVDSIPFPYEWGWFYYNKSQDMVYLLKEFPNRWWKNWQDIPTFTDKEVNQRVGYVVKGCHIEWEE